MRILTPENKSFNMINLPDGGVDLFYSVLDYSTPADVDFYFIPLVFLDRFPRPAADLKIGPYRIQMPLDWSIVIADKNIGNLEIIEIKHLNDRDFDALIYQPCKGFMPAFEEVTIQNTFPDITWNVPKLKNGHILSVPLQDGDNPPCAFFIKDINRTPEVLDITKVFA